MTIFELVKVTLDELYGQGFRQYGHGLDAAIQKQIQYLTQSYAQLTYAARIPVNYQDPATRFAYVYKYVTAHGDYLVQLMNRLKYYLDDVLFSNKTARVTCVGGGPGSDIIAVLKFLDEQNHEEIVEKVICYLLDREQAWSDTWTELDESLGLSVQLNTNFQPLDVTNLDSWKHQQKFLQADLFTMSYFVSEVCHLDTCGDVSEFWSALFQGAKPGALFIYIDNGHEAFNSYFDSQWQTAGLTRLIGEDNTRWTPRYSEQASDLGIYRQKFGQQPKLQSTLSYRVLRKE